MKEYPALSSILLLAIAASPSWAKPKAEIAVEVVSVAVALSHSPSYHPAIPDTSTTVCTPNGEKCTTTPTPGHPASIDNLEYYSHFIYAIFPDGRHVTLQYEGFKLIYPPQPGKYTAETESSGKWLRLQVSYPDAGNSNGDKLGKLTYRIVGIW
jgi:hypothetical protein